MTVPPAVLELLTAVTLSGPAIGLLSLARSLETKAVTPAFWLAPKVSEEATGGALTVRMAALLVALPAVLVKTARYWFPLCDAVTPGMVRGLAVAPVMLDQVEPPLVLTCHWMPGAGEPEAAALKAASVPGQEAWSEG